ncbi:GerAB/ArcD/ProY family transporter [Bacillus sp. 03113]|uniref:YkvI family membrane protein n=1 Tax=Bacillus sp. 03113 TaxID=2578211 RepID=UPI0011432138|nr:GerAB/ArcD/ProY family transporter [Bacillus sp. 03113]
MKIRWGAAFQIAAVYVGTVVGAGFATGQEIVEFFTRFGFIGLIGIVMSGYLFIFLGSKLMRIAAKIEASSYQELMEHLFGKVFSIFINIVLLIMLVGVCAVMLSGSGAVFHEHFGLAKSTGVYITIILSLIVMQTGMKGLFAVNSFVVPIMIAFSFFLMFHSFKLPNFTYQLLYIPFVEDGWKAVASPFSYTALNLALAQAVLVPVAKEIKDDQTLKWGGILGGVMLTAILIASHATMIMLPNVTQFEIPMAIMMKKLIPSFYWVYVLIIYGEIFTSVIGNVFGIEKQIKKYTSLPSMAIVVFIFIITYIISYVHYSTLLSFLYPLFGYISLLIIILLWMYPFETKKGNK